LPQASVHRHVHRVGHVRHRHLGLGPAWVDGSEDPLAHAAVQFAHAVHAGASTRREVCHVERFVPVLRMDASKPHQLIGRETAAARVIGAIVFEQRPRKRAERGGDRRVRREDVAGPRRPQRREEVRAVGMHVRACALDGGEGRVALVQVTDVGLDAERRERSPAADAEDDFLQKAVLAVAAVELRRDAAVER
jgi:hypothetical protein